jgi:hypothetical protein
MTKIERLKEDDPETRRLWKRFRQVSSLPERDRKAVIRLINSLVSVASGRPPHKRRIDRRPRLLGHGFLRSTMARSMLSCRLQGKSIDS